MAITIKNSNLETYLNATKSQHNNYGFEDFTGFIDRGVSKRAMANIFGVAWQTVYNWIKIYKNERGSSEVNNK